MILLILRIFSTAREAAAGQILTFGIISREMSFTDCLEADASWVGGRFRLLPTFTAAPHSPQCSLSTTPISNRWILLNVPTLLATLTRVSARIGSEWVLRPAGLIQALLPYRLPVSLATPDEICCGGRGPRNLTQRSEKILRSPNNGRSRLEWNRITCSTIPILAFRVIPRVHLAWGATETPSSRMRRGISPITSAKS